jgi:regulator of protease activity HflC (stomatin/prohibitin superfamily)
MEGEEGLVTRVVDRRVQQQVKNVFGKFNAITAIQQRERLNDDVQTALQSSVVGPLLIESVQIENIDFSDAYEQSVEQRMLAEVEVQKLR